MDYWLWFLMLVTLVLGYSLGHRNQRKKLKKRRIDRHLIIDEASQKYISGLNYLLNEEGDAAAEAFIDALPVSQDTLATHLSLGCMLRKNGEIASAIRTHQSLLASPYLDKFSVDDVQLELAIDYVFAGLLDRAETLLVELVKADDVAVRQKSLVHLVALYRDESEWAKAIEVINRRAERRFGRAADDWPLQQSHFSCELAELSIDRGLFQDANRQVKAALAFDKRSARASLLSIRLNLMGADYPRAYKKLKKLIDSGCDYWVEITPLLSVAFCELEKPDYIWEYLLKLSAETRHESLISLVVLEAVRFNPEFDVKSYLQSLLDEDVSLSALLELLERDDSLPESSKAMVMDQLQAYKNSLSVYTCRSCGYTSKSLHWLCPACKNWGSSKTNKSGGLKVSLLERSVEG